MTIETKPQLSINWTHGRPSKGASDDERRAIAAAESVLGRLGFSPEFAAAEYQRDANSDGGIAWESATYAADRALTEGWHNPDGAGCELVLS